MFASIDLQLLLLKVLREPKKHPESGVNLERPEDNKCQSSMHLSENTNLPPYVALKTLQPVK